ncbi:MAG: cation:proton antiporter [Dehalococcoidia bacterium]
MADAHLIEQVAIALGVGLAGGLGAKLVRLSPIVGYLAAGVAIGPFTPGYEGDVATLEQLAEIGIIFLMFGVGLHFNVSDLWSVRKVAIPGALIQMALVTGVTAWAGGHFGAGGREGVVLGFALAISSTVVVVRALEERGMMGSVHARVAIGWLIVQDIATVFMLAMLPALEAGGFDAFVRSAGRDLLVAAVFLAVVLTAGARVVPWLLAEVARLGSRELFILAVVCVALGVAAGAAAAGLSVALGAFVGGVVVSEKETSHQAAADVVPLREAFAVLFFVSVGMLLDPAVFRDHPGLVATACGIVFVVKGLGTAVIAAAFPYPARTALFTGAGIAQVGEFSFIIAREGVEGGLMHAPAYNAVLAAAVLSITLNPITFAGVPAWERVFRRTGVLWRWADRQGPLPEAREGMSGHAVIAGYGRVGQLTGHALGQLELPFLAVDSDLELVRRLAGAGIPAAWGDTASVDVLHRAAIERAALLVVCVPDESTALLTVANARRLNPGLRVIVRARDAGEVAVMRQLGAGEVVVPEYEGGLELMRQALIALGYDAAEALRFSRAVRDTHYLAEA